MVIPSCWQSLDQMRCRLMEIATAPCGSLAKTDYLSESKKKPESTRLSGFRVPGQCFDQNSKRTPALNWRPM